MILTDKNNSKIIIECDCGCEAIELSKWEVTENTKEYCLSILTMAFYANQKGFFEKLFKRIKFAWHIITTGTHRLQEIILNEKDFRELKEVINKFE
jgi:hypothetical protein